MNTPVFKALTSLQNYPKWESSAVHPDVVLKEIGYYEDYKQDARLADLLCGKRIAFVCPSPHLNGLNLGAKIDSYDWVIRVGTLAPIPERLHQDCGKRTDMLIHSFNEQEITEAYLNLDFMCKLRFVLCAMVSSDWEHQHIELMRRINTGGGQAQNVSDHYLYRVFKEVGTVCNVGLAGLLTLLNYDIKEIFVAGMGFYNMGSYGNIYNSDYYEQVANRMKIFIPNDQRHIEAHEASAELHRQQPQIDYFTRLLRRDKRITIDSWMASNLPTHIDRIKGKILYIDIDGILCVSEKRFESGPYKGEFDYSGSTPQIANIDLVNELYLNNTIVIYTARGKRTGKIDWSEFTIKQLEQWGVNYHDIRFDKPHWDWLWDDKSAFDKRTFLEQLKTEK